MPTIFDVFRRALHFGKQAPRGSPLAGSAESIGRSFELHAIEQAVDVPGHCVGGHDQGCVDGMDVAGL
jgi:hypothetical protein